MVLNTQPTADVTIALSSSDTTEGTVGPASLIFTTANWNVAQTVTVTGVDDAVVDGDVGYTIVTAPAASTDPNYTGVNAADVAVTNTDNDAAGITVTPTAGLTTTEAGGTATFTVVLTTQPTADVTIALSSSDTTEGTVRPASLTFTPRELERARRRSRSPASTTPWTTATSPTRSSRRRRRAPTRPTTASTPATSRSPTPTTT